MERPYKLILNEIPAKGIGYLLLERPDALEAAMTEMIEKGATTVLAKGALTEGETGGFSITLAHSMLVMERSLECVPAPEGKLRLAPLTIGEAPVYIQIHNENFFRVPNSATIGRSELDKLLRPQERAGLAWLGTRPVGDYDCILEGEGKALIDGIGLLKDLRGKGLGRELLRSVLALLKAEGFTACQLLVSTANEAAFGLYRAEGFTVKERQSTWYQVRRLGAV